MVTLSSWKKLRSSILEGMLVYYAGWKHPYYLFNNNKDIQRNKEMYYASKKRMNDVIEHIYILQKGD